MNWQAFADIVSKWWAEYVKSSKSRPKLPVPKPPVSEPPVPKPKPEPPVPKPKPKPRPAGPTGTLRVGQTYKCKMDGFKGNEADTKWPASKDNPEYIRHLVERATRDYCYSSRHVGGRRVKWVGAMPNFLKLGSGRFRITTRYRATKNRAKNYDAKYQVIDNMGNIVYRAQVNQYAKDSKYHTMNLGIHYMRNGYWVKMLDAVGTSSICFSDVKFKLISYGTGTNIPPPIPKPKLNTHTTIEVASVRGQSFMCAKLLSDGNIMAGCYSHPDDVSQVRMVGYSNPIDKVLTGEAVFRITEDNGEIILSCEKRKFFKDILRQNPMNYNFKLMPLKLVPGPHSGCFDTKRVLGKLVYLGGGEIYVNGKTRKKWDKEYYVKFIFQAGARAYVGGYDMKNNRAGWFESTDCYRWKWKSLGDKYNRFMRVLVSNDQKTLWLVGTKNYKNGHNRDSAAIWRYDIPTKRFRLLKVFKGFDYSTCIVRSHIGILVGTTIGWKSKEVGASLFHWTGKSRLIEKFPEAEMRDIIIKGDKVYVVTRTNRIRGKIRELTGLKLGGK